MRRSYHELIKEGVPWNLLHEQIDTSWLEKWVQEQVFTCYRICEEKNGSLYTLFHGVDGSRQLPMRAWIKAKKKDVYDGVKERATQYLSGFHVFLSADECRKFRSMFRKPRHLVLVKCKGQGLRPKTHSRANIYLADRIKLLKVMETLKHGTSSR